MFFDIKVKVKLSLYIPKGSRRMRLLAREGGKLISPKHRPPLSPKGDTWYLILLQAVNPGAIVWPEGLSQCKISKHPIGNRTRNLMACSAVPQPTTVLHTPFFDTV
jgi:hypothetical protein